MIMPAKPQSFQNHGRYDFWYHWVLFFILFINFVYSIVFYVQHMDATPSGHFQNGWLIIMAFGLLVIFIKLRTYPLKVQDRVIRLEEQLRLRGLGVSEDVVSKLNIGQLVGLRFAPDEELPSLAALAAREGLSRKQIKEKINNWRADNWRV
jgi:Family of unknown function (DUF6526)